jgi:O-antigen biosynthesis protein
MRFSIVTPTHNPRWLRETHASLAAQTFQDWEWVVVPNAGAEIPAEIAQDPRVRVARFDSAQIGALKRFACEEARGEYLVELDHDDLLTPDCLQQLSEVEADFIYSNAIQVDQDWNPVLWGAEYGWTTRPVTYQGKAAVEQVSPPPTPANFSRIWYAPNHVRVWRKAFYDAIGGHNPTLGICDDHELLCRTFLATANIRHIDAPLYVYRVHGGNSWLGAQAEITQRQWALCEKHLTPMYETWCDREQWPRIDLGGALDSPGGYTTYDRHNADIIGDLNQRWALDDSSVGMLRAYDLVEHLRDPVHTMNEAHRVLTHGGLFDVLVPSTDGKGAWCDPTHVSFWNDRSFRYYTEAGMRRYIEPGCTAKFQAVRVINVEMWGLPYVRAWLLAIKDGPRLYGDWQW